MNARYEFIDAEKADYPVVRMCGWSGVSTSGYYEWRTRPASATAARRQRLKLLIARAFDDSDGTYGYRRVHANAGPEGCSVATAAAQNPIVYQRNGIDTCFQRIEDGWESEDELLRSLKAVRDDLYDRFEPFRKRRKSDLSDADIDRDTAEQLAMSRRFDEDEVSAKERAEVLRAFRRAWWVRRSG